MDASSQSKRFKRIPTLGILVLLSLVLNACTWFSTSPKLETLTLAAPENRIALNTQLQITARADYANNTHKDVSGKVSWSSSNSSLASVDKSGVVTALSTGEVTISAKLKNISASYTLTVSDATLSQIQVSPADLSIAKGFKQQYSATALLSDGTKQDISGQVSWLSTPADIVSIDDNGIVTAITKGTTAVVAQVGNATGSALVTVTDATLQSISISTPAVKLPLGNTQLLSAFGIFSDHSKQDITNEVTWASDNTATITVEKGLLKTRAIGSATITANMADKTFSQKIEVSAATLQNLIIEPHNPVLPAGITQQVTVSGIYSDGSQLDVTSQAEWSNSSNTIINVDTLNKPGELLALSTGSATLTASVGDVSISTTVSVSVAELAGLSIDPATTNIAAGLSKQLSASARYTDGTHRDVTGEVIWATTPATNALIDNSNQHAGLLLAKLKGETLIAARLGEKIAYATVNISEAKLASLHITPTEISLANGHAHQYRVTGLFSDQTSDELTDRVSWSVENSTLATISNEQDNWGILQTTETGATVVKASYQGVVASSTLTVSEATLQSLQIEPVNATIPNGTQLQFVATGLFSDDTHRDLSDLVTWQSNSPDNAAISTSGNQRGLATAYGEGRATITAGLGDIQTTTSLTVSAATLQNIEVSAQQTQLALGLSQQLVATGIYSDNTRKDISSKVSWSSSNDLKATISNDDVHPGLMTAWDLGDVTMSAQTGDISGNISIKVSSAVLEQLTINATDTTLAKGTELTLTATGTMSDGRQLDLTQQATWASADDKLASIGDIANYNKGLLQANAEGRATIHVVLNGKRASIEFSITAATLDSIAISPIHTTLPAGATQQLTLTATYSDQSTQDITQATQATWSTDNTSASVGSSINPGFVTTLTKGTVTITASYGGKTATSKIDITDAVLQSIAVSSTADTLYQGQTLQFSATGTYSDSSTQDLSKAVTWSVSDTSLASISNAPGSEGKLSGTGSTDGSIDVSASLNAVSNSKSLAMVYDLNVPISISLLVYPNIILDSETPSYIVRLYGVDPGATIPSKLVRLVLTKSGATIYDSFDLADNGSPEYDTGNILINGIIPSINSIEISHPTDVAKSLGVLSVEASIPDTNLTAKSSLYVTDDISDAIGTASSSNYQINADTVTSGSTFSFSIVNFSNRSFSLDSYEFTNSGTQIVLTTDPENLNNNTLNAGENITITTTLSAPQSAPFNFIGKYVLTDKKTGTPITVSKSFVIQ